MLDKTIYPRMRVYTCVCKPRFCANIQTYIVEKLEIRLFLGFVLRF